MHRKVGWCPKCREPKYGLHCWNPECPDSIHRREAFVAARNDGVVIDTEGEAVK